MTPWTVARIHVPWYNSNIAHQREKEPVEMKAAMEGLIYQARVDVVLARLLVAASPVQVVIGSFLPSNQLEPKPEFFLRDKEDVRGEG
jgi:hypothetical protein